MTQSVPQSYKWLLVLLLGYYYATVSIYLTYEAGLGFLFDLCFKCFGMHCEIGIGIRGNSVDN